MNSQPQYYDDGRNGGQRSPYIDNGSPPVTRSPPGTANSMQPPLGMGTQSQPQTASTSTRIVDDPRLHSRARDKDLAGVGIVFVDGLNANKSIAVMTLVRDGPAERDGTVQVGDVILAVDGEDVQGQRLDVIRNLILGPPNTSVDLSFRSKDNIVRHVTLVREKDLRSRISLLERENEALERNLQLAREQLNRERETRERLARDLQEMQYRSSQELERERQLRQDIERELRNADEQLRREAQENQSKEMNLQSMGGMRQKYESDIRVLREQLSEITSRYERLEIESRRFQSDGGRVRELEKHLQQADGELNEIRERNIALEQEIARMHEILRNQREPQDRIVYVDRPYEVPTEVVKEVVVEKPVERTVYVDRPYEVEREVPVDRIVEKFVEVPVERIVEKYVEVPVDRIVEKIVEVPVERIVEKYVEVPVERIVEKFIEVPVERVVQKYVEVPVDRVVEKYVEVPVDRVVEKVVEKVVDRPVYYEREPQVQQVVTAHQGPEMGGVGLLLKDDINDEEFEVERLLPKSPAAVCGQLRSGDRVIGVDSYSVRARPLSLVKEYIRGPVGTPVTLHFRRGPPRRQRDVGQPEPDDGSFMFSVSFTRAIEPVITSQYAPPPVEYRTSTIISDSGSYRQSSALGSSLVSNRESTFGV